MHCPTCYFSSQHVSSETDPESQQQSPGKKLGESETGTSTGTEPEHRTVITESGNAD